MNQARPATSWGAHQEAAAQALRQLVLGGATDAVRRRGTRGTLPGGLDWAPEHVEQLLWCREALLDAAGDQLAELAGNPGFAASVHRNSERLNGIRFDGSPSTGGPRLLHEPAAVIATALNARPRLAPGSGPSPAEVLGTPSPNPVVELWREAAVQLTAGAHSLTSARVRPWASAPDAAWWLLSETATLIEAIVVLDSHLARPHMLGDVDLEAFLDLDASTRPRARRTRVNTSSTMEDQRLALAAITLQARMYGADAAADRATSAPQPAPGPRGFGPQVVIVRRAADLLDAQTALTALLRVHARRALPGPSGPTEDLTTPLMTHALARAVVLTQLSVTEQLSDAASRKVGGHLLAATLQEHVASVASIKDCLEDLAGQGQTLPPQVPFAQLREIRQGLAAASGQPGGGLADLDLVQLIGVGEATHRATQQAVRMIRTELNHPDGTLGVRARLIGEGSPPALRSIRSALAAGVALQWPTQALVPVGTAARDSLRETLRETRTARNRPSPFLSATRANTHALARGTKPAGHGPGSDSGDSAESLPSPAAVRVGDLASESPELARLREAHERLLKRGAARSQSEGAGPNNSDEDRRVERRSDSRVRPPSQ